MTSSILGTPAAPDKEWVENLFLTDPDRAVNLWLKTREMVLAQEEEINRKDVLIAPIAIAAEEAEEEDEAKAERQKERIKKLRARLKTAEEALAAVWGVSLETPELTRQHVRRRLDRGEGAPDELDGFVQ